MGATAKGKVKVTLELKQSTIDAIDRQSHLLYGARSRSAVVDDTVDALLNLDTEVASDVYGYCMQRTLDLTREATNADPITASDRQIVRDAYRDLARALSTALIDDRGSSSEPESEVTEMKMKGIKLSEGRFQIVPENLVLLNPEMEGKAPYLYGVWFFDVKNPCDQVGACEGKCVGPLMGWVSNRKDLYTFGQHKPARFKSRADADDCQSQVINLMTKAQDCAEELNAFGDGAYCLAWAEFDMWSCERQVPMGTGFPFEKVKVGADES